MTKQPYTSMRGGSKNTGALGRVEQAVDDDRPLAEIRRNVHGVLRMLSLHRWAFFVPFCLVTCAAFVLSLYYPRTYRATTSFERRNDPVMMNLPMSSGAASFKYFRNSMVRDLTSTECVGEVVETLGLISDLERDEEGNLTVDAKRRRDSFARSLAGTLGVSTVSPSELIDVIRITYTGPDPTIGTKLVDEVKRTYIRRTMGWIYEYLTSQRDYFRNEAVEVLATVKKAQRAETRLRLENPRVDPINPGAIALSLSQLEMERRELELRRRAYEAELSGLRQLLAATESDAALETVEVNTAGTGGEAIYRSPRALQLSREIRDADAKIKELKTLRGMTDRHPEIVDLLARREHLAARLQGQSQRDGAVVVSNASLSATESVAAARPFDSNRARILVQIAAQESKLRDLTISIETNDLAIGQVREAKQQIFQKQEEFAEIMGRVAKARQTLQQVEATVASIEPAIKAIEQNRLLQFSEGLPARGSSRPISPKATTVVLLAILAGVATGVLFVVLAEVFDHVYRSSGQVARTLGLPMLEAIDEIVTPKDRRYLFVRRVVLTPLVVACFIGCTGLAGSMAFLSIEQPWTYQKLRKIPEAALHLFAHVSPKKD